MNIALPELCLVLLVGPSGAGKSTLARRLFKPTEILSSDFCRGLVSDDENSLEATKDAFDTLHYIAGKRLARGLLTVIDATNVQPEARKPLVALAREHDVLAVAIVLQMPDAVCQERNRLRPDRTFGPHVVRSHSLSLRKGLRGMPREGIRYVHVLTSPQQVDEVTIERQPLWPDRRNERGPFDIIGDIHGCYDELVELMTHLGYRVTEPAASEGPDALPAVVAPEGRRAIFLGDLVDRGPNVVGVLKLVMQMVADGSALCVPGNHDVKLVRKLSGRNVQVSHGLAETLEQLAKESPTFVEKAHKFLDGLVSHYVLDGGKLVVAHAGMKERFIGRASGRVREFALYGETTGEADEFGLPVRYNWAADYRGFAHVVYGHTPVPEADWLNRTINIDTGCVFGGRLTALRWPEKDLVSVGARRAYAESRKPLHPPAQTPDLSAQQSHDDLLDLQDVIGKRVIASRLLQNVTVREENAAAALEVMSRFAVRPHWLIYLPPTMSPCQTSQLPGLLEHPQQAFDYFLEESIPRVICQEKHMGSRAVAIVCRNESVALRRFGVRDDGAGIIYTRTGRRFFDNRETETALLDVIRAAISAAGFWEEFNSDWFCFDCELMPWSAKAQDLLRNQYAAVGAAARAATSDRLSAVEQAAARLGPSDAVLSELVSAEHARRKQVEQYVEAYRRYCWPVRSVADLKLAPFHLLASERGVHADRDHLWHMSTLSRLAQAMPGSPLIATKHLVIDVTNPEAVAEGVAWWERLTSGGGEGMVVKPLDFAPRGRRGLVQPAVKCRGKEYLRIIYGPEYDTPVHLERLKKRGLGAKRSLALREFALGIEALERFVRREPLRRVHECVFAVLAMESEPVDPRL